jgi:hypothetical protein
LSRIFGYFLGVGMDSRGKYQFIGMWPRWRQEFADFAFVVRLNDLQLQASFAPDFPRQIRDVADEQPSDRVYRFCGKIVWLAPLVA